MYTLRMSSSQLTFIFFRGACLTTNQSSLSFFLGGTFGPGKSVSKLREVSKLINYLIFGLGLDMDLMETGLDVESLWCFVNS